MRESPQLEHLDCLCSGFIPAGAPALFAGTPRLRVVRCGGVATYPRVVWRGEGKGGEGGGEAAEGWGAAMLAAAKAGASWPAALRRDLGAAQVDAGPPALTTHHNMLLFM